MNGKEVNAMLFAQKEKGQGLVEYALILVLVAIVVIAALTLLGPTISTIFTSINTGLTNP
jgi:pilus assembly protein Flp/PilA